MNETLTNEEAQDLWNRAVSILLSTIPSKENKDTAERYFSMVASVECKDDVFTAYTSNSFSSDLLSSSYKDKIKSCLVLAGSPASVNVIFSVDQSIRSQIQIPQYQNTPSQTQPQTQQKNHALSQLNKDYTFNEFVVGPSNSFAHASAKGVVENPGMIGYNPLFIYGGTGLGKTHLMQAIGHELIEKNPDLVVCYTTTEDFLNEYVNSLTQKTPYLFREKYRHIDVFLIDDIQFLKRGQNFQEEFFNTFNSLISKNKQVVMTSDVPPKNLPLLESRLISRFEGGIVQEIESPSYETRLAILKKKNESSSPIVSDFSLSFIADKIRSHVRAMEGALAKLKIFMRMNPGLDPNSDILSTLLKSHLEKEKTLRNFSIEDIQQIVAKKFSVSLEQIISVERTQSLVTPRQLAMYISRKYTTKSLEEIGKAFGKSHATILHGVKQIQNRISVESELKRILDEIVEVNDLTPVN